MEFFTGFLWVVECTVIFIALILLFYLNVEGFQGRLSLKSFRSYFILVLGSSFFLLNNMYFISTGEVFLPQLFNNFSLWENYYEALFNINMNDFKSLTITYYSINSFEFIMVGFILLVGSLVCVNLNRLQKSIKIYKYSNYFNVFDFFKDFLNYTFMRKQNLLDQTNVSSNIRIFKKKN